MRVRLTPLTAELDAAITDWNSGAAYLDNAGNYRLKREDRYGWASRGPIAWWNREIKHLITVTQLHRMATQVKRRDTGYAVIKGQS